MHIQGREFRFEGLNITVAYFADEADVDFDGKIPAWLGDDCPFDDTFNDIEDFTLREGGGVLLIAASNLTGNDMKLVNELVSISRDDRIKLLICDNLNLYNAPRFDAVIASNYDLVNSIYDLAFSIYVGSKVEAGTRDISDLDTLVRKSRKGVLIRYWDDRNSKNLITPYDLAESWPFTLEEIPKAVGMYTWPNPASGQWSTKSCNRFVTFGTDELNSKHSFIGSCTGYEPEFKRKPNPDVIQLIMF